jgi:indolepyruvate ferredoxin oxidoreductase beta subunit
MQKKPKNYQTVLAGVGGQGIIYLNRVLARAAMDLGFKVYCLEEHGMARRGGSVATYMRFGDDGTVILNPMLIPPFITSGEYPDKNKLLKFLKKRFKGEHLVIVNASELANELGSPITMNMVLLGVAAQAGILGIAPSKLRTAISSTSSLAKFEKINLQAFEAGMEALK